MPFWWKGSEEVTGFFVFLFLVSIMVFIAGMVKPKLVIRWGAEEQRTRKKVAITYLGLMVASFVMVGVTAPKTENTKVNKQEAAVQKNSEVKPAQPSPEEVKKQQQEAFKSWYAGLETDIKKFDDSWNVWKDTFGAMSDGKIGRHQAYGQLKPLGENMKYFKQKFYGLKPPSNLSKEHQKLISDAAEDLGTMAYCREQGVEKALKFLDDMKPSSMQEAKEEVESSNAYMMKGLARIIQVQQELDLIEKKQ